MSFSAGLRAAAVVVLTTAAGGVVALGPFPAHAAECSGTAGVTVVVERGALGGGTQVSCSPEGGGRTAARLLQDAGHELTFVQRFPGFVCRIDGVPADDPCVNTPPADAYWGLWWSDGKSGTWTYSSLGAGSLDVPAGGYIAMVWDGSTGTVRPSTAATPHATPTPTPTKQPTTQAPAPTATPTLAPSTTATPDEPSPTASPTPTKKPQPSRSPSPTATPESTAPTEMVSSEEQTEAGAPINDPIDDPIDPQGATSDDGLPGWVAPVVVVLLLGGAGAVALTRRRSRP